MTATIRTETTIAGLPSASGVEIMGSTAYIIGDDAPLLYQLDAHSLQVTGRVSLFETTAFVSGRIAKAEKPDLECMAAVRWPDGRPGVLLFGSGSLPTRARGWFVPTAAAGPGTPLAVDLSGLYDLLRPHLPAGAVLNLEAAATSATELLLFQRTVGRADGALLFRLPLAASLAFLTGRGLAPAVAKTAFKLPEIAGSPAGFSGATFVDGLLIVTASVENTTDAVLDGEVLGSFVGLVNLETQQAAFALVAWHDGRPYRGKVEGLAVRRAVGQRHWELLLVTDDDRGGSTAVVAELSLG